MSWQDDLIKKAEELKIEGGKNVRLTIPSTRISNRDISRSSTNVHRLSIHKEINNVKGKEEKLMITREAALDDLEKLEQETSDPVAKVVVRVAKVIVKMLATIRSNQLLTDAEKIAIQKARAERKPEVKA